MSQFPYSLFVYPFGLFVPLAQFRPMLGPGALALTLVPLQAAHVFAETAADQYGVWAHNASSEPDTLGQPNLLGLESQALGVLAAGLSILLSVFVLAAAMSLVADAWRSRATLRPGGAGRSSANG